MEMGKKNNMVFLILSAVYGRQNEEEAKKRKINGNLNVRHKM